jgi:hypothetical protein
MMGGINMAGALIKMREGTTYDDRQNILDNIK